MKIYVAGSWPDRAEVAKIARGLEEQGHEITCKWYDQEEDCADTDPRLTEYAEKDRRGVLTADCLVACPGSTGTWCEIGMAIAVDMPVVYLRMPKMAEWSICRRPNYRESIFFYLEQTRVVSSEKELAGVLVSIEEEG